MSYGGGRNRAGPLAIAGGGRGRLSRDANDGNDAVDGDGLPFPTLLISAMHFNYRFYFWLSFYFCYFKIIVNNYCL